MDSFGSWIVLDRPKTTDWRCRCICGKEKLVAVTTLRKGTSTNCGCLKAKKSRDRWLKHGLSSRPEYFAWADMRRRCLNKAAKAFRYYGERGIGICDRWLYGDGTRSGVECFISDMGDRPTPLHSLDRIDNNGNYEPENCRWATKAQQAQNRRCCSTV